jgi:sialate O-acetylesterase
MVMQQDLPVRIWGHAKAGELVTVAFQDQQLSNKAGEDGRWAVRLKPVKAGGPYSMTISGEKSLTIEDILVGEVWLGAGEFNMNSTVEDASNAVEEIAHANYPMIRFFDVSRAVAGEPAEDVDGHWVVCSPETVPNASATGYFFSREIHKTRQVPVGFINASTAVGSAARAWVSRATLEADPALVGILGKWQKTTAGYPAEKAKYDKEMEAWREEARIARQHGKKPAPAPQAPIKPGAQAGPAGLYNGMIAPLANYSIRGVVWQQGETNAVQSQGKGANNQFGPTTQAIIYDWRRAWGEGSIPFLVVQLAGFGGGDEVKWPEIREYQRKVIQVENTALVVTIDIGDPQDRIPKNKQEAAGRMALAARHLAYGEQTNYSGPLIHNVVAEGNRLRASFDHVDGGLKARGGGKLTGFTIAGKDGKFVPAEAKIAKDTVLVSNPEVKDPVSLRYGWAADPVSNLVNKEGLPASPFRADADSK